MKQIWAGSHVRQRNYSQMTRVGFGASVIVDTDMEGILRPEYRLGAAS